MTRFYYKKSSNCIHGVPKDKHCPACEADNAYIKSDIEAYNKIYERRRPNNFALAFQLKANFNKWKKTYQGGSIDGYLHQIEEAGKLKLNPNTLKHAYYVALSFPDLENVPNRKLYFSIYSEIANSHISKKEKIMLRQKAEEAERITVDKMRNIIARGLENRTIRSKFKYEIREQFLKEVDNFMKENIHYIHPDTDIIISIKPRRAHQKSPSSILLEEFPEKPLPNGDRI